MRRNLLNEILNLKGDVKKLKKSKDTIKIENFTKNDENEIAKKSGNRKENIHRRKSRIYTKS
jgi:hypothetical protein